MPNHDSAFRQQILDVAEAQGEPDMGLQPVTLESQSVMNAVDGATIERRIRISQPDEGRGRCKGSRAWVPRKDFCQCMPRPTTRSTSNVILPQQERTEPLRDPTM